VADVTQLSAVMQYGVNLAQYTIPIMITDQRIFTVLVMLQTRGMRVYHFIVIRTRPDPLLTTRPHPYPRTHHQI